MKLYVGNLSFETTENDLQDLFEQHGTVNEVHLMMDRMTGKSRGFAFVTMNDNTQANTVVAADGVRLRVFGAKDKLIAQHGLDFPGRAVGNTTEIDRHCEFRKSH